MKSIVAVVLLALLIAACGGDDEATADASTVPDANPPTGTISLTWTITSGGGPATCEDVSADFVVLELVRQGEGGGDADPINCGPGEATTRQLLLGTYDIDIDLVDGTTSLLAEKVHFTGIEVTDGNDTPLGEVAFEL